MTPSQYKAAAQAIEELIRLGLNLSAQYRTDEVLKSMNELSELRDALEAEGMK